MQVTLTLKQLVNASRLSNKACAAMHEGALAVKDQDLRSVFLAALEYNAKTRDTLPPIGFVDIFGEWTKERLTDEANEYYAAHIEIRSLACAMDVDL